MIGVWTLRGYPLLAGEENRTLIPWVEAKYSTVELHLRASESREALTPAQPLDGTS